MKDRAASLPAFVLSHPYWVIARAALIVMAVAAVLKKTSEWSITYIGAATMLRHGRDIYGNLRMGYTYPPFSAWLMVPFSYLPAHLAQGIWFLILACCLIYFIRTSWRLAGGSPLEPIDLRASAKQRENLAFLLGHACALQLTLNAMTHLQTDVLIAALLTAGTAAILGRRFFAAASWIGVAAAFKATPLLFAPYLIWRRQWAAAAWLILVAIAANLAPNLMYRSPHDSPIWLVNWYRTYMQPMAKSNYVPGDWKNLLNNNQSLAGAANRWLTTTWTIEQGEFKVIDRPGHPPPTIAAGEDAAEKYGSLSPDEAAAAAIRKRVRLFFFASCLFVLAPALWAFWPRRSKARQPPVTAASANAPVPSTDRHFATLPARLWTAGVDPHMIECGIIMLLMLLLSPNSSRAHFCIMYLPAFCVARIAVQPRASWPLRASFALAILFSTLSIHIRLPFSAASEQELLWLGVVMLSAIFLLFSAAIARNEGGAVRAISA